MGQASAVKVTQEAKNTIPRKELTVEDVRTRAYEIFVDRAGAPGDHLQDWLQAERELLSKGR